MSLYKLQKCAICPKKAAPIFRRKTIRNDRNIFNYQYFRNVICLGLQRKTFIRKSKVFPLVKQTGWKPNPHTYRKAVGTAEVVCGAVLAFVPGMYT